MDTPQQHESQSGVDLLWDVMAALTPPLDSLVARVYEALWKQIVGGERQPGERLIDGELATDFGVSRTPIRQALLQLQQLGFVSATPRRGFHVTMFSVADLRDLYDLRVILEQAAVRAATPHIPAMALGQALDTVDGLRALPEARATAGFIASDIELHHRLIAGHCGNRRLAEAIATQHARLSIFVLGGTRIPGGIAQALGEHEAILRALLARDADAASLQLTRHLERVRDDALILRDAQRPPRVRRLRFTA